MLYLKNGYLIDPASGTEGHRDILIKDGKIAGILPQGTDPGKKENLEVIDLKGQIAIKKVTIKIKESSIMTKTIIIRCLVFPCPILCCQFTV